MDDEGPHRRGIAQRSGHLHPWEGQKEKRDRCSEVSIAAAVGNVRPAGEVQETPSDTRDAPSATLMQHRETQGDLPPASVLINGKTQAMLD